MAEDRRGEDEPAAAEHHQKEKGALPAADGNGHCPASATSWKM